MLWARLLLPLLGSAAKPNIVLVLTDDQDLLFDSMRAMPFTTSFLRQGGVSFSNFFAHTPVCCPSRGELLSGRYLHNLRASDAAVHTCMRLDVDAEFESRVFAIQLQRLGYTTAMVGKYLNGKTVSHCPAPGDPSVALPAGWDRFFVMCPDTCYVDCLFGDDGVGRWFNDSSFVNGSNYAPSLVGNVTVAFIEGALSAGTDKPFMAYVAPHSPHSPSTPAPWYSHTFPFARAPRGGAYNVSASEFHWAVAVQPPIDFMVELTMDHAARARLQTLLTVDDTVRAIVASLQAHNALDNTFLFFSSDHGFHMGQHCLSACKRMPYDTDIRIPFYTRGPGIMPGSTVAQLAGLPDVAPTILTLAGAAESAIAELDGKSLVPLFPSLAKRDGAAGGAAGWRQAYLIEYIATQENAKTQPGGHVIDNGNNTFRGLRLISQGQNLAYFEFTDLPDWNWTAVDFHELFDLTLDPYQLRNIYNESEPGLRQQLALQLRQAYACRGMSCM